jgi:hypothetical protein
MNKSTLTAISDVWNLMSDYVNPEDRSQLADNLIIILMEHDYDLEDIRHEFDGDSDIMEAVKFYSEDTTDDYETDEEYDELNFDDQDDYSE